LTLLTYVAKRENMGVDELIDKCHSTLVEMKVRNL